MWLPEDSDVRNNVGNECVFISFDMEWVGKATNTMTNHRMAEIAACNLTTGDAICVPVRPAATDAQLDESDFFRTSHIQLDALLAQPVAHGLGIFDEWLARQVTPGRPRCVLVGHNAFRADCIVLRQEMYRASFQFRTRVFAMDSLLYARHVLRGKSVVAYDLPSLCAHFGVVVENDKLHGAAYDTVLLANVLGHLMAIKPLSGLIMEVGQVSPTVVDGIGPYTAHKLSALGVHDLHAMVSSVPRGVSVDSCRAYLCHTMPWMDEPHIEKVSKGMVDSYGLYMM